MTTRRISDAIGHLRDTLWRREGAVLTDGQLLEDFISRREEQAVAALVRRHGPMVWSVCRRVLRNHHDAEDAFQATFLVLVRKAASVRPREMVVNWLYGVAYQTALKARSNAMRRQTREKQVSIMPDPITAEQERENDLLVLLDQELSRLPDKYRVVVLLCDLEGKTRQEAAEQLEWPEGTVAGRLARARAMLAKRLAKHGLAVAGAALVGACANAAASTSVPDTVLTATIKTAQGAASGQGAVVSAPVAALTNGVMKAMLLGKLKLVAAALTVVFGGGLFLLMHGVPATKKHPSVTMANAAPGSPANGTSIPPAEPTPNWQKYVKHHLAQLHDGIRRLRQLPSEDQ